jgi:hypothetical protein
MIYLKAVFYKVGYSKSSEWIYYCMYGSFKKYNADYEGSNNLYLQLAGKDVETWAANENYERYRTL